MEDIDDEKLVTPFLAKTLKRQWLQRRDIINEIPGSDSEEEKEWDADENKNQRILLRFFSMMTHLFLDF